jgi:response regulator RpfG family c-di-GMP phosphodiesterase
MRIMVVDDKEEERYLAQTLLQASGYEVETATNGVEALERLRAGDFDMIVSDILMPVMDGFRFCQECKRDEKLRDIPFVFHTATYKDAGDEDLALQIGADRFVRKPSEPEDFLRTVEGLFRDVVEGKTGPGQRVVRDEKEVLELYNERLVVQLETKVAELEAENARRKQAQERLDDAFIDLAQTMSRAMEARDPYTAGHQRRVAELARLAGERLGLDTDRLQGLYIGALLHDTGKVSIPESILGMPRKLTDAEWNLVQSHALQGYEILKEATLPWPVAEMALHHHERIDGSGYPDGISGDELSPEVRIIGVCDVVEAMGSHRPYRPARSRVEIVEELKSGRGTKYDARVTDILLEMVRSGAAELDIGPA